MSGTRPSTVVYVGCSLDRFIARPGGELDWLEGKEGAVEKDPGEDFGWAGFIKTIDAMVMGRNTFEKLLTFDKWYYGDIPLIVLSTTLKKVPQHLERKVEISSLSPKGLLEQLAARKFKRVYVDGGKTVQSFMRERLIDEMILSTLPVLIGQGIPLFGALESDIWWEFVSTKTFKGGMVQTHYRRVLEV